MARRIGEDRWISLDAGGNGLVALENDERGLIMFSSVQLAIGQNVDDDTLNKGSNVTYNPSSLDYDMKGEKLMFIFNHYTFKNTKDLPYLKPRVGTHRDVERLQNTFGLPGRFKIDDSSLDLSYDAITQKLEKIRIMDHSNTSCIAIVILTHGDENENLFAFDKPYPISEVIYPFVYSPRLAGKPKLFFIQACRGDAKDPGHPRVPEYIPRKTPSIVLPTHSDLLILRSSVEDYTSYRISTKGSWLIQSLCDVIHHHYEVFNALEMMTLVHAQIAKKVTERNMKQISEVSSTLTKNLKFVVKS